MALAHRFAPWIHETRLLEAFDLYVEKSVSESRDAAAAEAYRYFSGQCPQLFLSLGDQRRVMRFVRRLVETMDERGPAAFARRFGIPLLSAVGFSALIVFCVIDFPALLIPCMIGAVLGLIVATRVAWMKLGRIYRYYTRMRKTLGTLHSAPIEYQEIDLSTADNPMLLKHSTELQDLGARHICDLSFKSALHSDHRARYYVTNDAIIAVGLLHKTETNFYFPARAVLLISTRFKDGRKHFTSNTPEYRKLRRATVTRRCILDAGGAEEVLLAHRRRLDKLQSTGAVPVPPPTTTRALVERLTEQHNETRELWKKSPYSWGDAIHAAFKVCRREYLVD
jgi:hypothetical protein